MLSMLLQQIVTSPSVQTAPHNCKIKKDAAYPQPPLRNAAWAILMQPSPSPGRLPMHGAALVSPNPALCPDTPGSCPCFWHPASYPFFKLNSLQRES